MAHVPSERIITAIDVGTTKICVLIAQQLDDNEVEILGMGRSPSEGLHKGVVTNVAQTVQSILSTVQEAELAAGLRVTSAVVGVSGGHISSVDSMGIVPIPRGKIGQRDIANALAAARAIVVPEGQKILHVMPKYFVIDGRDKVHDALGMHGVRLEVQAHVILGAAASVQNLATCCESAGVQVEDVVLEQLASADAVLSEDERMLGVGVLDIGGGTSDLAIYQNSSIRYTMVLPVAGNHFTHDLAVGLCTTRSEAERIKKEYGAVQELGEDETIEIDRVQGREKHAVQTSDLVRILQPRAKELLSIVCDEIILKDVLDLMHVGLVLTGGGSQLSGLAELAQEVIGVQTRVGIPQANVSLPPMLQDPMYATGYGLLLQGLKRRVRQRKHQTEGPVARRIVECMKSWVMDFF